MAWKAPPGFGGMKIGDRQVMLDAEGEVDMQLFRSGEAPAIAAALNSHGFVAVAPRGEPSPVKVKIAAPVHARHGPMPEPEAATTFDPSAVDPREVVALTRDQLVAYLTRHGVATRVGMDLAELRALARVVLNVDALAAADLGAPRPSDSGPA